MDKKNVMSGVGIIKNIDDIAELKDALIEVFETKSKKDVSRYGLLLAEHALTLADMQPDGAINAYFDVTARWQEGKATYQETRQAAAAFPDLAREEKDPVKVKIFRILGQVALIPHVKRHALIASDYAITLVNLMWPKNLDEVRKERTAQIEMMKSV